LRDILIIGYLTNSLGFNVFAFTFYTGVSIITFELEWRSLNVLESVVHKSSIAPIVCLGAVYELLLREGLELSS